MLLSPRATTGRTVSSSLAALTSHTFCGHTRARPPTSQDGEVGQSRLRPWLPPEQ